MIGDKLSHYQITGKIGQGGMGVVYRARDLELERDVAIKLLLPGTLADDATRKRFRKEALSLAKLNHPNIATIFEFGSQDSNDFLVTEYIPGVTLQDKLKEGPLPEHEAATLGSQLARGLTAAHQQAVIHRDLKPGNLRLTPDGHLKILDFGLAQLAPHASEMGMTATLTQSHEFTGTLPYMAPEQLRGQPADARTDIWSAGAVLYEMATAKHPFPETSAPMLTDAILHRKPEAPRSLRPGISAEFEQIILKALEKDPARRFQSAQELGAALEKLATPAHQSVPRVPQRVVWIGLAALFVVACLGAYLSSRYRLEPSRAENQTGSASPVVHARRAVAVLGFKNLAGRPDEAWLSTALAEMLTTELQAGQQLRTIPGETVARVKLNLSLPDSDSYESSTLDKIRRQTNADDVVLGSYLALGESGGRKVRVDLRLQDSTKGETIAAIAEEGTETELAQLVRDVGTKLRETLGAGEVTEQEAAAISAALPSTTDALRLYSEGLAKLRVYDGRAALDLLQKAVAADPNYALAHMALSEAWSYVGNTKEKMQEAKKAYDLSSKLSEEDRLWIEARYYDENNDNEKALKAYKALFVSHPDNLEYGLRLAEAQKPAEAMETIKLLRALPSPSRDDPRIDLREALALADSPDKALELAGRAQAKALAHGDRFLVAATLADRGAINLMASRLAESAKAFREAKETETTLGDRNAVARENTNLTNVLLAQGDFEGARKLLEESLAIHREIGNTDLVAWDLNMLADDLMHEGNFTGAVSTLQEVLTIVQAPHEKEEEINARENLGEALQELGGLAGARKCFVQALAESRKLPDKEDMAGHLLAAAQRSIENGDLASAEALVDEVQPVVSKSKEKRLITYFLGYRGNLLLEKNRPDKAREDYMERLSISTGLGQGTPEAYVRLPLCVLAIEQAAPDQAEAPARAVKDQAHKDGNLWLEAHASSVLARSLLGEGKHSEAKAELENAKALHHKEFPGNTDYDDTILAARLNAVSGKHDEAEKNLNDLLKRAVKTGEVLQQYRIRLALGEIELKSGQTKEGRARLAALERVTKAKGYLLIAHKASAAMNATAGPK